MVTFDVIEVILLTGILRVDAESLHKDHLLVILTAWLLRVTGEFEETANILNLFLHFLSYFLGVEILVPDLLNNILICINK